MNLTIGLTPPRDLVRRWVKANARCDVIHQIIWRERDGYQLRTGCGKMLDARLVATPLLGARACEVCRENALSKEQYRHAEKRHHTR